MMTGIQSFIWKALRSFECKQTKKNIEEQHSVQPYVHVTHKPADLCVM